MATITRFEDLEIWQLARTLAIEIFETWRNSETFSHDYKLKDQINASSGSTMDNIAEGFERNSNNEFVHFLSISKGSCGEVKSQLYRAMDRKYITQDRFEYLYKKADELGKKIGAFMNYLNTSPYKGNKFKNRTTNPKP